MTNAFRRIGLPFEIVAVTYLYGQANGSPEDASGEVIYMAAIPLPPGGSSVRAEASRRSGVGRIGPARKHPLQEMCASQRRGDI